MNLLLDSIEEETLMKNNIRFRIIGDIKKLPAEVQEGLSRRGTHTSQELSLHHEHNGQTIIVVFENSHCSQARGNPGHLDGVSDMGIS